MVIIAFQGASQFGCILLFSDFGKFCLLFLLLLNNYVFFLSLAFFHILSSCLHPLLLPFLWWIFIHPSRSNTDVIYLDLHKVNVSIIYAIICTNYVPVLPGLSDKSDIFKIISVIKSKNFVDVND